MILLSLLLVLAFERITSKTPLWCFDYYFNRYVAWLKKNNWFSVEAKSWTLYAQVFIPALLIHLLINILDNGILELLLNTAVLGICVGCPQLRASYKNYLQAANRGDTEACCLYADELGHEPGRGMSVGQTLVWINYRYYCAVILWFALFGAAGALFYVLCRNMLQYLELNELPNI